MGEGGARICHWTLDIGHWSFIIGHGHLVLQGGDGGDSDDIVNGAAAAEVIDRLGAALEKRAVGLSFGEALGELIRNVTGIEIGENEDVGFAGDGATGGFFRADGGNNGGVGLELAINHEMGRTLFDDVRSSDDFVNDGIFAAAFGGEGEHGDNGLDADEGAAGFRGDDGDVGELFSRGIRYDAAIGIDEHAVVAVGAIGDDHEEATGESLDAGFSFEDVEGGADSVGGAVGGASDVAIGEAFANAHGGDVEVILESFGSFIRGHAFIFAKFGEFFDKVV